MIPFRISKPLYNNKKYLIVILKFLILVLIILIIFFIISSKIDEIKENKKISEYNNHEKIETIYKVDKNNASDNIYFFNKTIQKCYFSSFETNIKIIHLIITRFLIRFYELYGFPNKLYTKEYIPNGIRVMKKYLIPSLENQSCKNFTWILMLGNRANISYVESLIDFKTTFPKKVVYQKDFKNFLRNITEGFDILITSRIDYDDGIYYDAVNDVRKVININRPILLYGYNSGVYYLESNDKYYYFNYGNKKGVWSIFISLILVLNQVNDTYSIYDLGDHSFIKNELLKSYKSYGVKELNYEPFFFDNGDPKFIYVRQKYSGSLDYTMNILKNAKEHYFNLSKFYGK